MMKKIKNKLAFLLLFLLATIVNAQQQPPCPGCGDGGTTPGAPASPIDMYVVGLVIAAVCLIFFYARKIKNLEIK